LKKLTKVLMNEKLPMYSTEGSYIIKKLEIRIFIFVLRASN